MTTLFADTSFFLALLNPNDQDHVRALRQSSRQGDRLVTTEFVLMELAGHLSATGHRQLFLRTLAHLRGNPLARVIDASSQFFGDAVGLYAARQDKSWSLVDCASFLVMQREGIQEALTADHHFQQAGFNALLLESA